MKAREMNEVDNEMNDRNGARIEENVKVGSDITKGR